MLLFMPMQPFLVESQLAKVASWELTFGLLRACAPTRKSLKRKKLIPLIWNTTKEWAFNTSAKKQQKYPTNVNDRITSVGLYLTAYNSCLSTPTLSLMVV